MPTVRDVLTADVIQREGLDEAAAIDDDVQRSRVNLRVATELLLLSELPEGFTVERSRPPGCGGPRGFELSLFDERRRPRRRVASVARRYIGRPLVQWSSALRPGALVDLETTVALAVVLRLTAVE